ncbi:MAG: aminopeptidase P family protein [Clostridia bacterium]|nr:aminopeptidase P family protein [Clostridia bacterium]
MSYQQRWSALARAMAKQTAALLITHPANVRYLCGFTGEGFLLAFNDENKKPQLFTDTRFTVEAQACAADIGLCDNKAITPQDALPFVDFDLGIEAEHLSTSAFLALKEKTGVVPTKGLVESLRIIKDAEEITLLKSAAALTDEAFIGILSCLAGLTERQIAARLLFELQNSGAEGPSFPFIVASGENGAKPHAEPGDRTPKPGEMVTIDFGCVKDGYCSDLTRTVPIGRPGDELRRLYRLVAHAQKKALACIRPGLPMADAHNAACSVFEFSGMLQYFTHSLGHGVGLEVHEAPRVNKRAEGTFQPGMVITCEPGLYVPGVGGVRIEDTCVVEEDGITIISREETT